MTWRNRRRGGFFASDSEYEVVPLRPSWGSLSVIVGLFSLATPPLFRNLLRPSDWQQNDPFLLVLALVLTTTCVAGIGLALGMRGVRRSESKVLARIGVFLNGTVLSITFLLSIAVALVWLRR